MGTMHQRAIISLIRFLMLVAGPVIADDVSVTPQPPAAVTTMKVLKGWLMSEQGGIRWAWNIGRFLAILAAFWLVSLVLSSIVESMNMLMTTIRTVDNKQVIVPNGKIGGDSITNATASSIRRVDLVFGVSYADDLAKVQAVLEKVVAAHPRVLADPVAVIKVNALADSSVNFIVRPWAKTADYWDVSWDLTRGVKEAFDREGISIPFPQRDLHVYPMPPSDGDGPPTA